MLYHTVDPVFPHFRGLSTTHGRLLDLGFIAVSFFFTLSGYILTVSYLPRKVSKEKFWRARFARVYPLFFLTLLLDAPSYLAGLVKQFGTQMAVRITSQRILENALMLQAWIPTFRSMDWPNWSLSVEAFFYFLCPFLLPVLARFSVSGLVTFGMVCYGMGMFAVAAVTYAHISLDILKFDPLLHLNAFLCGAALGASRFRFLLNSKYAPALVAAALTGFVAVIHYYPSIPLPLIHDGLLVPAFSCAIIAFDCGHRRLNSLLSSGAFVLLGEASYALYLLHIPLWHVVFHLRLSHSPVAFFCYLIVVVTLSIFCFRFVETPLRKMLTDSRRERTVSFSFGRHGETNWALTQPDLDAAPAPIKYPLI